MPTAKNYRQNPSPGPGEVTGPTAYGFAPIMRHMAGPRISYRHRSTEEGYEWPKHTCHQACFHSTATESRRASAAMGS
jgi:hypothetical protein